MAQIKGLLFDKDGTLLDFYRTWLPLYRGLALEAAREDVELAEKLLRAGGLDPETDRIASGSLFQGGGMAALAECYAEILQDRSTAELTEIIARHVREGGTTYAVMMDGVIDEIAKLKAAGYKLGVATNDTHEGLHASLAGYEGFVDQFLFCAGCDTGHGPKPEPGMALAFAAAVGLAPEECAIIGDSTHDLETGRAAGFGLNIGVLTGPSDREDLEPHADMVLDSMLELSEALARHETEASASV